MISHLAICLYGYERAVDLDVIKKTILEKLPMCRVKFFESFVPDTDPDIRVFLSLQRVAFKKRSFEIQTKEEFDLCIALNINNHEEIKHFKMVRNPKSDTVYYTRGGYNETYVVTFTNPDLFYADSFTFDRACEYYLNLPNIEMHRLRGYGNMIFGHPEIFYYHLKTLILTTECVNNEDRNLFERTT